MDSKHAQERGFKKIPEIKTIGKLTEETNNMIALVAIKKAQKAAFIFELLCKELEIDPFSVETTWHVVATQYKNAMDKMANIMEKQKQEYETATDQI